MSLNEKQITELARPLVRILEEFFRNQQNQENFENWLKEVQNAQSHND